MHKSEWSLISFTLLSQMSVGLLLGLVFIHFVHPTIFFQLDTGFSYRSPELIMLSLVVMATLISFLHLGNPLHSFNALNNLNGSWISREILMLSVFGLSLLILFLNKNINLPGSALLIIGGLSGILLIFSMARIYMIPTIPVWNNFYTPFSFIFSALIFGSMGMMALILLTNPNTVYSHYIQQSILMGLTIIFVNLLVSVLHFYKLTKLEFTGLLQLKFNKGNYFLIFIVRMILMGVILAGLIYIFQQAINPNFIIEESRILIIIISFIIMIEELMGRYLFYKGFFRLGV